MPKCHSENETYRDHFFRVSTTLAKSISRRYPGHFQDIKQDRYAVGSYLSATLIRILVLVEHVPPPSYVKQVLSGIFDNSISFLH